MAEPPAPGQPVDRPEPVEQRAGREIAGPRRGTVRRALDAPATLLTRRVVAAFAAAIAQIEFHAHTVGSATDSSGGATRGPPRLSQPAKLASDVVEEQHPKIAPVSSNTTRALRPELLQAETSACPLRCMPIAWFASMVRDTLDTGTHARRSTGVAAAAGFTIPVGRPFASTTTGAACAPIGASHRHRQRFRRLGGDGPTGKVAAASAGIRRSNWACRSAPVAPVQVKTQIWPRR